MTTVRTRLLQIMWIKFGVNIDPACDIRRKWSKKYMQGYVILGVIKKNLLEIELSLDKQKNGQHLRIYC